MEGQEQEGSWWVAFCTGRGGTPLLITPRRPCGGKPLAARSRAAVGHARGSMSSGGVPGGARSLPEIAGRLELAGADLPETLRSRLLEPGGPCPPSRGADERPAPAPAPPGSAALEGGRRLGGDVARVAFGTQPTPPAHSSASNCGSCKVAGTFGLGPAARLPPPPGMPKRTGIHSILVLGSGPIGIGQACEFEYSGTQASRVPKRERGTGSSREKPLGPSRLITPRKSAWHGFGAQRETVGRRCRSRGPNHFRQRTCQVPGTLSGPARHAAIDATSHVSQRGIVEARRPEQPSPRASRLRSHTLHGSRRRPRARASW